MLLQIARVVITSVGTQRAVSSRNGKNALLGSVCRKQNVQSDGGAKRVTLKARDMQHDDAFAKLNSFAPGNSKAIAAVSTKAQVRSKQSGSFVAQCRKQGAASLSAEEQDQSH